MNATKRFGKASNDVDEGVREVGVGRTVGGMKKLIVGGNNGRVSSSARAKKSTS
jgi:hypothetical protein